MERSALVLESLSAQVLFCEFTLGLMSLDSVSSLGEQTVQVFVSKSLPDSFQVLKFSLYKSLAIVGCEQKFLLSVFQLNQSYT